MISCGPGCCCGPSSRASPVHKQTSLVMADGQKLVVCVVFVKNLLFLWFVSIYSLFLFMFSLFSHEIKTPCPIYVSLTLVHEVEVVSEFNNHLCCVYMELCQWFSTFLVVWKAMCHFTCELLSFFLAAKPDRFDSCWLYKLIA